MAKNEKQHLVANDGSDWTTPPSPVDPDEKREADKKVTQQALKKGQGPRATNNR